MLRILDILFEGVVIYLLYKLIFNFIIPVYRSTKKVRKHMRDMQGRMNDQMRPNQQQNYSNQKQSNQKQSNQKQYQYQKPPSRKASPKATYNQNSTTDDGEYIDYEEVK